MLPSIRLGQVVRTSVVFGIVSGLASHLQGELIDDFNDGDDVGWTHADLLAGTPWGPTIYDASSGRYAISSTAPLPPLGSLIATGAVWTESQSEPNYSTGVLRTTIRADNSTTNLAPVMRFDMETGGGYAFGANFVQDAVFIARVDAGFPTLLASLDDFELAVGQDYIIEAGAFGPDLAPGANLTMKIWAASELEPRHPQLSAMDSNYITGAFGLVITNEPGVGGRLSGTFDDVIFIPEPASLLLLVWGGLLLVRRRVG